MNRAKKYEIFIDVISKNNLRNKDIVEKTGYSKARISNFKNDAESIPDDFFDIFLKIFDQNNDRSISNYVNEEQAEYQPVVKKI